MTPAERAERLRAEYVEAARRFSDEFGQRYADFSRALDEAEKVHRGPNDRRKIAQAARQRVREALHAAAGTDPDSDLAHAKAEFDRLRHEMRALALTGETASTLEAQA